jgi:O-antigen biosynthesis protein
MINLEEQLKEWEKPDGAEVSEQQVYLALKNHPEKTDIFLNRVISLLIKKHGIQSAYNLILRMQAALKIRKPSLGLYDNAFHFVGGAQKYGCTLAAALQDDFDITLIGHRPVDLDTLKQWYDVDLSRCRTKIIPMPYFENKYPEKEIFDAGEVDLQGDNPFHAVSRESGNYDIFVNNCMLEMVYPMANHSEFVCHFPERERSRFFHVGQYSHIIFNSLYTANWIRKRWQLEPDIHIYPPVDLQPAEFPALKKTWILSVSRFEPGGNKQQQEMARIFLQLKHKYPEQMRLWRLVLAGGSIQSNPYLEGVKRLAALPGSNVDIYVNISIAELKNLYQNASVFWHFSGLGQSDPEKIEHFGMTTVEAMQNGCVPVVFNGGGQKEIVTDGRNGLFFKTRADLETATLNVIQDSERRKELARAAFQRGKEFTRDIFMRKVKIHFLDFLKNYRFEA